MGPLVSEETASPEEGVAVGWVKVDGSAKVRESSKVLPLERERGREGEGEERERGGEGEGEERERGEEGGRGRGRGGERQRRSG